MTKKYFVIIACAALCFAACGNKHSVKISGNFANMADQKLVFAKKGVVRTTFLDSLRLDKNGNFSTKVDVKNEEPAFITISNGNGNQLLMLLAENGENIKVNYSNGIYTVEGSENSALIKNLGDRLNITVSKLDSLSKKLDVDSLSAAAQNNIDEQISKIYVAQKRSSIEFLVKHPKSYASIFALYQQLPNGMKLFGKTDDLMFFKLIVDSIDTRYKNSEYATVVRRDYESLERVMNMNNKLTESPIGEIDFPEITLNDRDGNPVKLSSLKGKTILLEFWAGEVSGSDVANNVLLNIYNRFKDKGFEIYQVSLDTDRNIWLRAIKDLPWISVCSFKGTQTEAVGAYNVIKIPSNFLIDKSGNIIAKDIHGDALDKKLSAIL